MAAKRFSWSMIGTETNFSDFRVAERNVERNSLSEKVQVIHNDNKSVIFPASLRHQERVVRSNNNQIILPVVWQHYLVKQKQ